MPNTDIPEKVQKAARATAQPVFDRWPHAEKVTVRVYPYKKLMVYPDGTVEVVQ